MLIMNVSSSFMMSALKLHDWAGKLLGMETLPMPHLDSEINWAMMQTEMDGHMLFTMYGFIGEKNSEAWKYRLSVLPGKIAWTNNINELRTLAVQDAEMRESQLALMQKDKIQ